MGQVVFGHSYPPWVVVYLDGWFYRPELVSLEEPQVILYLGRSLDFPVGLVLIFLGTAPYLARVPNVLKIDDFTSIDQHPGLDFLRSCLTCSVCSQDNFLQKVAVSD